MKRILYSTLLLTALFFRSNEAQSQVFNLVSSPASKLNYAVVNDQYGFAMVGGTNQFKSTDQGLTWTQLNSGSGSPLYLFEGQNIAISSATTMCIVGYSVATASYTVVRTVDGGLNWTVVLSTSYSEPLRDIASNGNTLIVTGVNGVYRSVDGGLNWNFLQLSTAGQISTFVRYNAASASWVIGGYQSNFQYSSDDGVSWQNLGLSFNPDLNILAESETAAGLLIARKTTSATQMFLLNAANTIDTAAIIQSNLVMGTTSCSTGAFFNGNLLTHNQSLFYQVDPATQNVYHFEFPASGAYIPRKIALGTGYGVGIASTTGGNGRIYRIDLAQSPNLYVPSYFDIAGPGPCAGDPIIASATANYADSVKWYVNNVLVSSVNTLNFPTPSNVYTTYNVKLVTYYHGVSNTTTKSVVMSAPSVPHGFTFSLDTTVCYGSPLHVFIDPNAGTPVATALKIMYNGQLIYGPVNMTTSNINATTLPVTESGIMQIISYKTNYCDINNSDTVTQQIIVGPNLFDFTILPHDSVMCTAVDPIIPIVGTNPQYAYDFFPTNSVYNPGFPHYTTNGNSSDTLEITLTGLDGSIDINPNPNTYGPIYYYVNLSISDNAGCTSQKIIDTIRVQRRTAVFELHSRSFLRSDTVNLSNAYITPNRLWSSPELDPAYIQNETAVIPLIISDTTGFFGIELRNEPIAGCADSMTNYIHYADQAPNPDTACIAKKMHGLDKLHRTKIDQFGNIYEIRVFTLFDVLTPLYIIRKNDPSGNLIWEKRCTYQGGLYEGITGIVVEEIDFDTQGNPVVAMWIHGDEVYQDDYIDFTPSWNVEKNECYVVKIDKNTGGAIWSVNLNEIAPSSVNFEINTRITDVVVKGDFIYASTYAHYNLDFFTLASSDGHLINTSPLDFNTWSNASFILQSGLINGSEAYSNRASFWSPQLDVLSTGEVIAIGNYKNANLPDQPQLQMTTSSSGIFAMKYHPDHGVYDVKKIAQTGSSTYVYGPSAFNDLPKMFVDKHDNITLAAYWQYEYENFEIQVLDSVLPMATGTFVLNMDKDYNMNWLSAGTHSHVEDLAYAQATDETFLACKTRDNFSMGTEDVNLMAGEARHYSLTYTGIPNYADYPWLCYQQNDGFITKFDSEGKPVSMKKIKCGTDANAQIGNPLVSSLRLAATACGDLATFVSPYESQNVSIDENDYVADSTMLFLFYSNCTSDDCSYLNAADSLQLCSSNGLIDIQLVDYYNLDSLSYNVVVNGTTVLADQSAMVVNGHFTIPVPAGGAQGFELAFTAPNTDTLAVVYENLVVDFGTFPTEFCVYYPSVALGNSTPSGGIYSGPGVTNSPGQFNPSSAGAGTHLITYTYTNQEGCSASDTLSVFVDNCLNVTQNDFNSFQMYPNPTANEIHLVFSGEITPAYQVVIADPSGRIVLRQKIDHEDTILSLNQLSRGNYTLNILDGDKCIHRRQVMKM